MPGFGRVLSEEEIRAISQYERSLDPAEQSTVQFTELHKTEDDK
jgi:mono/diheme cytochrome c family protein